MMKYFWTLLLLLLLSALAFAETKKIEGTTNVEDAYLVDLSGYRDYNYGGSGSFDIKPDRATPLRVKNVSSELPANATISSCVCSVYVTNLVTSGDVSIYRIFKPWVEGDEGGVDDDDGDVTWNDWASDAYEWTTEGCLCARDDGVDNSDDDGPCNNAVSADRKETAESTVDVTGTGWWGFSISAALAQAWYDGTANENGVLFLSDGTANASYNSTEAASNQPFWVFTYTTGEPEVGTIMRTVIR